MSFDDKIYLSVEEQQFLIKMLEIKDAQKAAEKFATIMSEERADPMELKKYIQKIMKKMK